MSISPDKCPACDGEIVELEHVWEKYVKFECGAIWRGDGWQVTCPVAFNAYKHLCAEAVSMWNILDEILGDEIGSDEFARRVSKVYNNLPITFANR